MVIKHVYNMHKLDQNYFRFCGTYSWSTALFQALANVPVEIIYNTVTCEIVHFMLEFFY